MTEGIGEKEDGDGVRNEGRKKKGARGAKERMLGILFEGLYRMRENQMETVCPRGVKDF